ncbi:hypothetical protein RRG08_019915, partial [Elysia crispata]
MPQGQVELCTSVYLRLCPTFSKGRRGGGDTGKVSRDKSEETK